MIISVPAGDHDHLADALVRDLGFTRMHVQDGIRARLLKLDPIVDGGVTMANQGFSPRLSSKLEQYGGWDNLLNTPRPGWSVDQIAKEVNRLLDVLAEDEPELFPNHTVDTVIVGGEQNLVAIRGRCACDARHVIEPGGVVSEQQAIVELVQRLRVADEPVATPVPDYGEALADMVKNSLKNDPA
jgi:hypothetical protein